ncbi:GyrI-like domain-containing protein [Devosia sp. SL43]|uniref:GyrI-like domain-containing protein n=1 Tax=Devosia sp. SL43 TaxID=2806348 RepID=UPI001F3C48AB|nr:effector binding domain-containing protein [Devosia sp. SL43]UJW83929.1 effector binding domain-containing protein [Devosia sp. SL43]
MRLVLLAGLACLANPVAALDLAGCRDIYAGYPAAEAGSLDIAGPEIVEKGPRVLAGLEEAIAGSTADMQIDVLWTRFEQRNQWILNADTDARTGVCFNGGASSSFDYFAGQVLVGAAGSGLPDMFSMLELPATRYAVFTLTGSARDIHNAQALIYQVLMGEAGLAAADQPDLVMFPPGFSPAKRAQNIEFWVPLEP